MVPNWNTIEAAEEHRRELLQEAEQAQKLYNALRHDAANSPSRSPRLARALARLGRLMVAWGHRLQALESTGRG